MSIDTPERLYGHHYPDHLRTAAHFIGYRSRQKWPSRWPEPDRDCDTPRNLLKSLVGLPGYVSNSVARAKP
jgi:hypothetical protein